MMVRIQGTAGNFLECSPVSCKTDRKWPDSSNPGFQQEVAMLEAFWKSILFIRIKIHC